MILTGRGLLPLLLMFMLFVSSGMRPVKAQKSPFVTPAPGQAAWLAEHEMHKRNALTGNFEVVFLGDSITERWRYPAEGKLVWDKKLAPLNAGEFGISGDGTQSVIWRLQD